MKSCSASVGFEKATPLIKFSSFFFFSPRSQDPILTGSASLWVLSNGTRPQYVDQYNAWLDPLDAAIKGSRKLATTPYDQRLYSLLDNVNTALVDLETIALDDPVAGRTSIFGRDYISNKGVYLNAVEDYLKTQYSRIFLAINSAKDINNSLFLFSLFLMGMGILFFILDVSPNIFRFITKRARKNRFRGASYASSISSAATAETASTRKSSWAPTGKQVAFSAGTATEPKVKATRAAL
jgi:hypothetical protein